MSRVAKQRRAELTRRELLQAAREAFAERGFAATSMEEIAVRVGVTRGPLYHYFDDKRDLFLAVYEEVERDLAARIDSEIKAHMAGATDALEEVKAGAQAFLDACLYPAIQRIAFLEAPYVLARGSSRDIAHFGLALLRNGLKRAMDAGLIERQPVEPLAQVLRAAFTEGAIYIARSENQAKARKDAGKVIDRLIDGLGTTPA